MFVTILNGLVLIISLALLIGQLWVRQKRAVHLAFAVFCGSIAMLMAKRLTADAVGGYHYLFGMGACLTCNGYWLVARGIFRNGPAIAWRHVLMAGGVALLIIANQGMQWLSANQPDPAATVLSLHSAFGEMLRLLSSTLLVLAFWEGCRGWSQSSGANRQQRMIFILSYGGSVLSCTIGVKALQALNIDASTLTAISSFAALFMLIVTQWLIVVRRTDELVEQTEGHARAIKIQSISANSIAHDAVNLNEADRLLASELQDLLLREKLFLQTDLKVADLARRKNVSEYRVSRVMRSHLGARQFNHYINVLRITHARELLADPQKQHWPILVIALECGFGSVGPFTRAFKAEMGCTPGEYRNERLCEAALI